MIRTIEDSFEYQVKKVLIDVLKEYDIDNLEDVDAVVSQINNNDNILKDIGTKLMERTNDYSGDEILEEVIEELL